MRTFLRHKCKSKKRGIKNAKESYRKERCAQLRTYAVQKLDWMLDEFPSTSHMQGKRRGYEALQTGSESGQPSKRMAASVNCDASPSFQDTGDFSGNYPTFLDLTGFLSFLYTGAAARSDSLFSLHPTPMPSIPGAISSEGRASGLFDTGLSSQPLFSSRNIENLPNMLGGPYAPIFNEITISPYFPAQHPQLHPFPYPAVSPIKTSGPLLPASGPENQGGSEQIDGATHENPY